MNPFALDGASFLLLYFGLMVAALFIVSLWKPGEIAVSVDPSQLQAEHWAALASGEQRAAQVAFVRLLHDDVIYWNEAEARYLPRNPDHPHDVAQALKQGRSVPSILQSMAYKAKPQIDDLERWGLLKTGEMRIAASSRASLIYIGVLLFGLARVAQGLAKGKPVGFLLALMALLILVWILSARNKARTTKRGQAFLADYERNMDHVRRAPASADILTAVALGGVLALNGTDFGHVIWAASPESFKRVPDDSGAYTYVNSCSSSDSSSGGSDSGGSGCGGSGCGGCGGGD